VDNVFLIVTDLLSSDVIYQIISEVNVYKHDKTFRVCKSVHHTSGMATLKGCKRRDYQN